MLMEAIGFTIAVSGASGMLGRELCSQAIGREWNTIALVRTTGTQICHPRNTSYIRHPRLHVVHHDDAIGSAIPYDAFVLALGKARDEPTDTTTPVVKRLCQNLPTRCRSVYLVSTCVDGEHAIDLGYLRDVAASKRTQEQILRDLAPERMRILPLGHLSYGDSSDLSNPSAVARRILDWCSPPLG